MVPVLTLELFCKPRWLHSTLLLVPCSFKGVDIALFSAGGSMSKKFGPVASDAGATVGFCFSCSALSRR